MEIEFDTAKRETILAERRIDMSRAQEVFAGPIWTLVDDREDYGEARYMTYGYLDQRMVFLAWTYRGIRRRIITIRKANEREQRKYEPRLR
jgi:uncharacterized DUF497 family protein